MQVFLIRHPRPLISAGICYGQLDVPAEDPAPVAKRLRAVLPADALVLSSPLSRCRTLAEQLHPAPRLDPRLMEMNFGEWEGKRWDDIGRAALDAWAADVLHHAPPGGESAAAMQARALACLADLHAEGIPVATIVAHAGILRALVGHWRGLAVAEWSQLRFDFGALVGAELGADGSAQLTPNR